VAFTAIPSSSPRIYSLAGAEVQVERRILAAHADVAVFFRLLDAGSEWSYKPDDTFHAASTMKVPVMMELFHQAQQGKLTLDDPVLIHNEFFSLVDGSAFHLDPANDSTADLYRSEGQTRTLRQLCELMITMSSNLATNLLIKKLGIENIRATVHLLGADGMNVLRGVEDNKAYDLGLNNTTTARGLEILLTAIAEGKAVDPDSSRQMIEILKRQHINDGIPSGLDPTVPVAHKTGTLKGIDHDAAIVYARQPFVLVILVRGMATSRDSSALMADITRAFYRGTQ
jgi:beta-lactamase class A